MIPSENTVSHNAQVNAGIENENSAQSAGVPDGEEEIVGVPEESSVGGRSVEDDKDDADEGSGHPDQEDGPVGAAVAREARPLGSVFNESGERRSARERRAPLSYQPSHQNRRYVEMQGVSNLNL